MVQLVNLKYQWLGFQKRSAKHLDLCNELFELAHFYLGLIRIVDFLCDLDKEKHFLLIHFLLR